MSAIEQPREAVALCLFLGTRFCKEEIIFALEQIDDDYLGFDLVWRCHIFNLDIVEESYLYAQYKARFN